MRKQVEDLGVPILRAQVERLESADGRFGAFGPPDALQARTVLLATGALDIEPPMPDVAQALRDGVLRYCPVCDGHEASDQAVGVLCNSTRDLHEALYLRHFTPQVQVFVTSAEVVFDAADRARLDAAGIVLHPDPVTGLRLRDGCAVVIHGGRPSVCQTLYSALGMDVHSQLAAACGAALDPDAYVLVDAHHETRVPGLFSAGDVAT